MATVTILRSASRMRLLQMAGPAFRRQAMPAAGALVHKKDFGLSPIAKKRVYGPAEQGHEETSHWMNERYLAFAMYPSIPLAIAFPHPALDTLLCSLIVLHAHWHMSGVAVDYIHGERLPHIAKPTILILSILTYGGLCYLNFFDIGFGNTVRMLYTQL